MPDKPGARPAVDLSVVMGLPPREAIHYFESKGLKISFRWQEVWREAHARSFTVAGVTRQDLLADIRRATADAIAEGQTAAQFRKALEDTLKRKGWWGKGEIKNPETGEVRIGERGSPARLNLIYRQNLQSAYNAGRYQQQEEFSRAAPYWRYMAVMDARTRPSHAAMHGRVYRWDDPIWGTLYPPNGWNCRCRVETLSERAFRRGGYTLESGEGEEVEKSVPIRNPLTGTPEMRPVKGYRVGEGNVFFPDAGFDYNPGRTFLRDLKANMPEPPQTQASNWKALGLPRLRDVAAAERIPAPELLPQASSRQEAAKTLAAALGFTGRERLLTVQTPLGPRTVWRDKLAHMVGKAEDARERYANYVLPTLEKPYEVWLKEHEDGKLRENYVGLFREGRNALLVVIRINRDGSLLWNMMQRSLKDMDKLRQGWLVYLKQKS